MNNEKIFYLHIGMTKTGSTSIQEYLYLNKEKLLKEDNIYYPEDIDGKHSNGNILTKGSRTILIQPNELAQIINNANTQNLLFSSETLSSIIINDLDSLLYLKELINSFQYKLKIICFLRRQDIWYDSICKYNIKEGLKEKPIKLDLRILDYFNFITQISDIINIENIICLPYQENIDIIPIFLKNISASYLLTNYQSFNFINKNLSMEYLNIKRQLNQILFNNNKIFKQNNNIQEEMNNIINQKLTINNNKQSLISFDKRLKIINTYTDSNKKLANLLGFNELFDNNIIENNYLQYIEEEDINYNNNYKIFFITFYDYVINNILNDDNFIFLPSFVFNFEDEDFEDEDFEDEDFEDEDFEDEDFEDEDFEKPCIYSIQTSNEIIDLIYRYKQEYELYLDICSFLLNKNNIESYNLYKDKLQEIYYNYYYLLNICYNEAYKKDKLYIMNIKDVNIYRNEGVIEIVYER